MTPPSSTPVVLGHGPMDSIHAEFDELLNAALASPADAFHAHLTRLIAHLRSHFGDEDDWMQATGFPPKDCHMAEHAAVLRSAGEVAPLVASGQVALGRSFVRELAGWFPGHATTSIQRWPPGCASAGLAAGRWFSIAGAEVSLDLLHHWPYH
jgi:hemerythrin